MMPKRSIAVRKESHKILQSSDLFRFLDDDTLSNMLDRFQKENWVKKRSIDATEVESRFHVILKGRMQVTRINEETGRMVTLFLLGPGDIFDVQYLLTGTSFDGILEARDNLELLSLSMSEARKWISDYPDFNRAFLGYLGKQITYLSELAGDLALYDTETRLAKLLLRHLHPDNQGHHHVLLINDLSHEVIAEMIGSVRAVVNRQLQHWRKKGVVDLKRGHIEVNRLEELLKATKHHLLPPKK